MHVLRERRKDRRRREENASLIILGEVKTEKRKNERASNRRRDQKGYCEYLKNRAAEVVREGGEGSRIRVGFAGNNGISDNT